MQPEAERALAAIRECFDDDRVEIKTDFRDRMDERGMFWPDVLGIVDDPSGVRTDGDDDFGRPRWFLAGTAPDGLDVELLCVIDVADDATVLITIYWE